MYIFFDDDIFLTSNLLLFYGTFKIYWLNTNNNKYYCIHFIIEVDLKLIMLDLNAMTKSLENRLFL